jgi:hypothetical protein
MEYMNPLLARFNAYLQAINSVMKIQIDGITGLAKQMRLESPELISTACRMLADRAMNSGADLQIPMLYVIDSIVKNVRGPWNSSFSEVLPIIFDHAWIVGAPGLHERLRRLVGVWSQQKYFSEEAMAMVDASMHSSQPQAKPRSVRNPAESMISPLRDPRAKPTDSLALKQARGINDESQAEKTNASNTPMTRDPRLAQVPAVDVQLHLQAQQPEILSLLASAGDISSLVGIQTNLKPAYRHLTNEIIKDTNIQGAVDRLRASTSAQQSKFLDNKFLKRKLREGQTENSTMWYLDLETWYGSVTGNLAPPGDHSQVPTLAGWGSDTEQPHMLPADLASVPADDHQTACAVSGEKFEKHWDDALQEWRYLDVVRVDAATAQKLGVPDGSLVCASVLDSDDIASIVTAATVNGTIAIAEAEGQPDSKRVKLER